MPVSIADLFVDVTADVSGALGGLTQVGTAADKLSNQFKAAVPAALVLEGAAAGVGAAFLSSVNVAADFEHQMSGVKAVMSPSEVQTFGGALDDLALTLGRDTVFSSSQAAAGIEELIKAGVPAQAVLEGAASAALSLAAATGIPVAEAATVAATAMNTFGVQAADLGNIVNVLAGTANASAADISQLQFGFQAVGPVAAQMGLSLEDTAAALGVFANNGLRGQDAGTSLKTMLLNLIPSTKRQVDEFKKLGLITADGANIFFNAEGHMRNLADIAEILKGSLSGLSDEQRLSALQTLFGTDAIRAASILYRTGGDAVNAFHEAVGKVSAADAAATRLDNLQGVMTNLGGSFERVQIQVGRFFLPALRSLADFTRTVVDAFGNLNPETQRMIVFIGAGAAAFAGIIGALVVVGALIPPLVVSFGVLNAVLIANPVGAIVTALAALVAVGVVLFNTNEDFRNAVLGVWDALQNQLWPAIVATASALRDQLQPFFDSVGQAFSQFVSDVGPQVITFFQETLPAALAAMGTQISSLGPLFTALTGFFGSVFNVIGSLAGIGGEALQGLFTNVLVPGFEKLSAALGPMRDALQPVFDLLQPTIDGFGTLGQRIEPLTAFLTNAKGALDGFADSISKFQLPSWLTPGTGSVFGGPGGAPGGAQVLPASFNPNGGGANGGALITIGQIVVTNEADEDRLIEKLAGLIADASHRVNVPPDNSGIPSLQPVFV